MRLEELANNNFIKGTDTVERYLLDIIKQYFSSNDIDEDSREYIINRAVEQMKAELNIDNAGVISINGKTGNVDITLEELQGEPAIVPKLSAFNVDFGNKENTACMGNDPRLYDSRQPIQHNHEIFEINGLQSELSKIMNNIAMLENIVHTHTNPELLNKLVYSGTKNKIDLVLLETAEDKINTEITKTEEAITDVETKTNDLIIQTVEELAQYSDDYNNIQTYVDVKNETLKSEIEHLCVTTIQQKKDEIDEAIKNKIERSEVEPILNLLNQQFRSVYETNIINFITSNESKIIYETEIPSDIVKILKSLSDKEYKISFCIKYMDPETNKPVLMNLPFIHVEETNILCTLKTEFINKSFVRITSTKKEDAIWPTFLDSSAIRFRIDIKNNLAEV